MDGPLSGTFPRINTVITVAEAGSSAILAEFEPAATITHAAAHGLADVCLTHSPDRTPASPPVAGTTRDDAERSVELCVSFIC